MEISLKAVGSWSGVGRDGYHRCVNIDGTCLRHKD